MAIDSHIHLYPETVYRNPKNWAEDRGEAYWQSCVAPQSGPKLQAWKSVDQLLHAMDVANIEHAVILAWYWENHDTCVENLSWQKKWIAAHPDRLSALAPFNAKGGPQALSLLEDAFDSGFKGIGELNPPAQGYAYSDLVLSEAIQLCAKHQGIANFHVTDPRTHDYPGKIETPYDSLLELAKKHPDTNFIFAHLGGCEPLRRSEPSPPNVYYDTAACPLLYKKPVYQEFCDKVGSEKILFGTDYPLRVFPRDKNAPDFLAPLYELQNAFLSEQEITQITSTNARQLFRLP